MENAHRAMVAGESSCPKVLELDARASSPQPRRSARAFRNFVLASCLVLAGVSLGWSLLMKHDLAIKDQRIAALDRELATVDGRYRLEKIKLGNHVGELEAKIDEQRGTIGSLMDVETSLRAALDAGRRQINALASESGTSGPVAPVSSARAASRLGLASSAGATVDPQKAVLEAQVASLTYERDVAVRAKRRMMQRVAMLETRLSQLKSRLAEAAEGVRDVVDIQMEQLAEVLADTGLDAERLVEPEGQGQEAGQGGPYVPVEGAGVQVATLTADAELRQALKRFDRMQSALHAVPLVAPLDDYDLSSGFGVRRDPITGHKAMHAGLDFTSLVTAKVRATAPGRVVEAGRMGDYGILVAIDHGQGITTRYAHLSRTLVKIGDKVSRGQQIAVMGSTGRSTGRHLHYEVLVKGEAVDPVRFLDAGRSLANVLEK